MNKYIVTIALTSMLLPPSISQAETAADNYKTYCMQCHGMEGNGMGANIQDMSVQPRDHTDAKSMGGRTDVELFKVIKEGGLAINKSSLMPPWDGTLTDDEIHELVQYLRKLCKCKHAS
ncbi:MAG: cytochrome c [Mariprofundus sp.]|nr:cytochrome c [Mariprofundus sp.]